MPMNTVRLIAAWRLTIAVALILAIIPPISAAAGVQPALPATAAAAPESTVLYHRIDLDRDGSQWRQAEALAARAGFPEAIALWEEEILAAGDESGDFTEADLDALLGGEMAIVVSPAAVERFMTGHMMQGMHGGADETVDATPISASDATRGVAGILVPGDPDAAWAYVERQLGSLAQRYDVTLEERSEGDADVLWLPPRERAGQDHDDMMDDWEMPLYGDHDRHGIAAARAGEYIVAAPSQEDVAEVVAAIEGDVESLADSAEFQALATELPAESLSFTYIDEQAIIEALDAEMTAAIQAFLPEVPPEAWGGQAAIALSAADEGFRFDAFEIFDVSEGPDSMLVPNDPAVAAAAERAPAGTFWFQAGKLPKEAFAAMPYLLAQAINEGASGGSGDEAMTELPSEEEIEEQIAAASATVGFDLRDDLFDLLGQDYLLFSSFPIASFDALDVDVVAAMMTTDPAALAQTARMIADLIAGAEPDTDVAIRRIGEDTVYQISDADDAGAPTLELGVVGEQAVLGVGEGIDQLQAAPDPSLADDEQFQTVMGLLPSEFSQVAYIDLSQVVAWLTMFTGEMGAATTDADFACADYDDQAAAQAAYEADPAANASLDLDFDGMACEDAFATPGATPATTVGSLESIRALGVVSFQRDEMAGVSAILYIAAP